MHLGEDLFRSKGRPDVWPYRGRVAAVGVGHSPTARRWDGTAERCVGALAITAIRQAMADADVLPGAIDGLVIVPATTTGAHWPQGRPVPEDVVNAFVPTGDPLDGIARLSPEWLIQNIPELTDVQFVGSVQNCMSKALAATAEVIGRGLATTCLVVKAWHNLDGRYHQGGENAEGIIAGPRKWTNWAGPASFVTAQQFQRYLTKYGKRHEMMAQFVINSRANGLLFPEGYWAQHRPEALTHEDYVNSRWVAKPANLFDNDLPIMSAAAYLLTTAERAEKGSVAPAYILNHASDRSAPRSVMPTLEEAEEATSATAAKLYEGAGIRPNELSFENMYDGFSLFHVFHLEGLGFAGIGRGDALDYFESEDITLGGPAPISPSGGNIGGGRTRYWMHTDSIQQIQHRAGARQIRVNPDIGVSGGPLPLGGDFIVWSASRR